MNNSTRNIHPNRLVLKHEQYLIDKSLANKIKNTKSTLNSGNRTFEQIIINRQKKDLQRSVLVKARSTECPVDSETTQTDQTLSSFSPHSCILSPKRNEMQSLRMITKSARENIENKASSLFSVRNGLLLPLISAPRGGIERVVGLKSSVYSSAGQRMVGGAMSPDRAGYMVDMRAKENQVETLKNRLLEKSLEAECLRKELKAWWHDDIQMGKSKENILKEQRIKPVESSLTRSLQDITCSSNTIKRDLNGKNGLARGYSDKKMKKIMPLGVEERKQLIGSVTNLATYEESLRILERFEELEMSNKKSQTPTGSNSFRFNGRLSRNLESRAKKPNMRYKTEGDEEMIEESRMSLQGNLSRAKENMSVVKEKYTNIRYKTLELDGEDCSDDEEEKPNTLVL